MKTLKTICFWAFNGLLMCGLILFSFYFFMKGDTFHGVLDLLYMLVITSNILFRKQNEVMKEQMEVMREGSKVLVEQNAKLTEKNNDLLQHMRQINDPFSYDKVLMVAHNVRMERIEHTYRYKASFLKGYNEMETNRRKYHLELEARQKLLETLEKTELIELRYDNLDDDTGTITAGIYVGVVGEKSIEEILDAAEDKDVTQAQWRSLE